MVAMIDDLYEKLLLRWQRADKPSIKSIGVKVKFNDFTLTSADHQAEAFDAKAFLPLLEKAVARGEQKSVRLIGLHLGLNTQEGQVNQLALQFDE